MRRALSIGLAALLVVAVVLTIALTRRSGSGGSHAVVRGVIGSEKQPFFTDPDVKKAFAKAGFDVQVDTAGSRQIATQVDLSKYDFAFPAGTPQAERIRRDKKPAAVYVPFTTPMAIATFQPIAQLLATPGVDVTKDQGGWWSFDMKKFLDLVAKQTRWSDLPGNTAYNVSKQVLITSTDVTTSNSAAMYASIASYVLNGDNVVANPGEVAQVADQVAPLFTRQGYTEQSSELPFEDYLSIGIGKTPMVMIYESQFVARAAAKDGAIRADMVLMYPDPVIVSKHTLVPLTANGDAIGRLMTTDPALQQLAVKYGFRTADPGAFDRFVASAHVTTAPQLLDVIEPPTYENLEALINEIAASLSTGGAATSTPSSLTTAPTTSQP